MTRGFKLSLALNATLAAIVAGLAWHGLSRKSLSLRDTSALTEPAANHAPEPKPVALEQPAQTDPPPVRWTQLESTDYRTYIANLRRIECPEQTIRDIIAADVHSLYAPRCQALERKKTELESGPAMARVLARQSLDADLQKLRREEAAVIATLLDVHSERGEVSRALSPRRLRNDRVAVPLVFQNVDPAAMKLDARQLAVIAELRQKFQEDLGGPNQDPADPAYRERWQTAQCESDDLLAGVLGGQFFLDYQVLTDPSQPPGQ